MHKDKKNRKPGIGIILAILFYGASGGASELHQEDGILSNHSAEYVRTLNRNTSTDPDAAFYNPAGLAYMEKNGLHLSFTSQTYYVKKTHTMDFYALEKEDEPAVATPHKKSWFRDCLTDEYMAELTAPVLPGFDIIWKQDNWAAYIDIATMQAAIDMTYGDGLGIMDWGNLLSEEVTLPEDSHLEQYTRNALAIRNEMYIGITAGGAYKFTDWISAGGGLRLIHAQGNMVLKMNNINFLTNNTATAAYAVDPSEPEDWDVDTDTSGFGTGLILSTHFRPEPLLALLKGLDATFRLEYYPAMELKKKTNKLVAPMKIEASGALDIFKDGSPGEDMEYASLGKNGTETLKVTYPATLNFGLSYLLLEWIKFETSAQISLRSNRDLDGREDDYNTGYQAGLGVEFILTPEITLSTGYLYNNFGIKPEKRTEADPLLNSHQIGGGAGLRVNDNLDINIGAFYQYYVKATSYYKNYVNVAGSESYSYIEKSYDEKRFSVAIGATYRLFSSQSSMKSRTAESDNDEIIIKSDLKSKNNSKAKKKPVL